jgi:ribosomal protein S18 acetylase RimI-like enzyme
MLVMVDPGRQRCGIGRRLLDQALAQLKQKGVREAQLGGGGLSYFWPGVPSEPPGAWAFFEACGWQRRESSYDLVCDLPEYRTPSGLRERVSRQGIVISSPEPKEIPALLEYEKQHFPQWLPGFEQPAATGEYGDLLVARDPEGAIVGSVQVLSPQLRWQAGGFVWEQLLGKDTGGIGSLGVMPAMEGRGIGLALAARATELLQARGLKTSYVGWTWLVDWYGRLGYRVWQEYRMCWKKLEESSG